MNTDRRDPVASVDGAQAALMSLCRPFAPAGFVAECEVVSPHEITAPSNSLLVHQKHMTIELERHYGKSVAVRVLDERLDGDEYIRKIGLTLVGTSHVVEWGICRLNLACLSTAVRDEILGKRKPLGAILIEHDVYRRIEPRYYVRLPEFSPVIELFGAGYNTSPVFGRLGTIYCDDEPAIELLEIAVNTDLSPASGAPDDRMKRRLEGP